ncbi:nucleoside-diphosphate sugar epimerase/dehydratase [Acaryochloris sp. IP29b_bin.137]|uniref:polysaccharide biosynthesis protein n=1 Tax=Acaryochloris sp. IP29b_bin.137 TaxID=2969217 RepID=UPI00260FF9E5|nr:nucleoside-diphosphate sugar epimerase/dehydratase [Acaryochloris sp. IP29b_bin.137]
MIDRLGNYCLHLRNRHFFLIDVFAFAFIPLFALSLRLDSALGFVLTFERYQSDLMLATVLFMMIKLTVFLSGGLYKHYWRYASIDELSNIAVLTGSAVILQILSFAVLKSLSVLSLPRSLPFLDGLLTLLVIGSIRFSIRALERKKRQSEFSARRDLRKRALIVGAGNAGVSLVQELERSPHIGLIPVAFVDDNPDKLNLRIRGLPVVGSRNVIPDVIQSWHIQTVIIAMPSLSGRSLRDIVALCQMTGVETLTLPALQDVLVGPQKLQNSIREVQIEDLLRREPIQTDIEGVRLLLRGKRVLVTGAGGSIGSELCRQIFRCSPSELILLGHGENSVFQIQQELMQVRLAQKNKYGHNGSGQPYPKLTSFIADLRHPSRLRFVFEQYQPEVVFHAAAHKHVPLMENNAPEAITNNVLGTKSLTDLAVEFRVKHFVMISTDKAVNPTSIMGASKRVAEMIVLKAAQTSGIPFVVVRFGNVLGSRGSVIPTFKQQIAVGGPVTVTHPDICRYFMTIPEAVQLVLQAVVISPGGEILMLNMGEPVKIVDLAKDLICLSGYQVGKDIEISYTGLRPGEKLFEELFLPNEEYQKTEHEKLLIVKNASKNIPGQLLQNVTDLLQSASINDSIEIRFLLQKLVPGYQAEDIISYRYKQTNTQ